MALTSCAKHVVCNVEGGPLFPDDVTSLFQDDGFMHSMVQLISGAESNSFLAEEVRYSLVLCTRSHWDVGLIERMLSNFMHVELEAKHTRTIQQHAS
jgi:hypothetical protein